MRRPPRRPELLAPGWLAAALIALLAASPAWGEKVQEFVVSSRTAVKAANGVSLAYPIGIKLAANGNLFAADTGNGRIVEISSTGKVLRTIGQAGPGPGQLNLPADMAADAKGNLYVADTMNHRIVHFGPDGRFVKAWGKQGEINGPHGIALGSDGRIYLADTLAHRILVFDSEGKQLASWSQEGSGPGQVRFPHGIVVGQGGVYVADFLNHRVEKFTPEGKFINAWGRLGSGPGEFDHPWGVDLDAQGNLWVMDMGNNRLQRISADGKATVFGSYGRGQSGNGFNNPKTLALVQARGQGPLTVFIGHSGENSVDIVKINPAQLRSVDRTTPTPGAGKALGLSVARRVTRLQKRPGAAAVAGPTELHYPFIGRTGNDGRTYVADTGNHRIVVLDAEGNVAASWGRFGSGRENLNMPTDLVLDSEGNVLVADTFNNAVKKFSPRGELLAVIGGKPELNAPHGLAIGEDGSLYVADTLGHRIVRYDRSGKLVKAWGGQGSGEGKLHFPHGLTVRGKSLYVADFQNHRIVEFNLDGGFVRAWGKHGTTPGEFRHPWGVAVGPDGDVWVSDMTNARIQRFNPQGKVVGVFGSQGQGLGQFDHIKGIDLTKKGELVVGVPGLHAVDFVRGDVGRP